MIAFPGTERFRADDDLALDTVLTGILDYDRRCTELLEAMMAEVRRELTAPGDAQRAAGGYRLADSTPRFLDRVS